MSVSTIVTRSEPMLRACGLCRPPPAGTPDMGTDQQYIRAFKRRFADVGSSRRVTKHSYAYWLLPAEILAMVQVTDLRGRKWTVRRSCSKHCIRDVPSVCHS